MTTGSLADQLRALKGAGLEAVATAPRKGIQGDRELGSVELIGRWRIATAAPLLELAEWSGQALSIRGSTYRRATLRGVPGKHADLIVAQRLADLGRPGREGRVPVLEVTERPDTLGPAFAPVLEVAYKRGHYDGARRRRYALRVWMAKAAAADLDLADLRVIEDGPEWLEIIIAPRHAPAIIDRWPRLRSRLVLDHEPGEGEGYSLSAVAGWQWRKYFTFLRDQEGVRQFCDSWAAESIASGAADAWTLSEANRAASQALYAFARALGWRKLGLRDKARLGIDPDGPQWWPEGEIAERYAALGHSATGCGEGTLTAAADGHWPGYDQGDDDPLDARFDEGYSMR